MRCAGLIVAGGRGRRFGDPLPKQFARLAGQPLLAHAAATLLRSPCVEALVLVLPAELLPRADELLCGTVLEGDDRVSLCAGGAERVDSVAAGTAVAPRDCEALVIHDAARPLASDALVARVVAAAERDGAAIAALPAHDTVKQASGEQIERTLDRRHIWLAQTPQVIRRPLLETALAAWVQAGRPPITDDAQLLELCGQPVTLVPGEVDNFKVTLPSDLSRAERLLTGDGGATTSLRSGIGYDVHRLVSGRPLILGGVEIPHAKGLEGHSDADVLAHAIGDALLGAAALGDLGQHFPPSDPRWAGADSLQLLRQIVELVAQAGLRPQNVDSVLICEAPKLAPHIPEMRRRLAEVLGLEVTHVAVKATTTEGLGFAGRGEGIAAQATVLLR